MKLFSAVNWFCLFVFVPFGSVSAQGITYEVGELLYADSFDADDLSKWHPEIQRPDVSSMKTVDGQLEISTEGGCTTFFLLKLEGPIMIEYEATMIDTGGPNDRVSDMNCFWMMKDLAHPDDIQAASTSRNGIFRNYWRLPGYYVGKGGNGNTTTRMRKHHSSGNGERIFLGEYLDEAHLVKANLPHKIQLVAAGRLVQYICDDSLYFNYTDSEPLTDGWFGFRQVDNRVHYDNFKVYRLTNVTGINDDKSVSPKDLDLGNNYPNPFNPTTQIPYTLQTAGFVTLKVYDILGNEIQTLVHSVQNGGDYKVSFDAGSISNGFYLYRLQAGAKVETQKMLLVR